MTIKRLAGSVKINGIAYQLLKEKDRLVYERKSIPKTNPSIQTQRVRAGSSNLVEYTFDINGGYGDAVVDGRDDRYHYGVNMYMEHNGEAVVLPGHQYVQVDPDDPAGKFELSRIPAGVFEIYDQKLSNRTTYIVQDCKVMSVYNATGSAVNLRQSKVFETQCVPSDAMSFNNVGYVAMGTTYPILNILSVASDGGAAKFTTAQTHYLAIGDLVVLKGTSVTAYNGIWKVTGGLAATTFTLAAVPYTATATGHAHKLSNRYLRSFTGGSTWSKDDNSYLAITAVTNGSDIAGSSPSPSVSPSVSSSVSASASPSSSVSASASPSTGISSSVSPSASPSLSPSSSVSASVEPPVTRFACVNSYAVGDTVQLVDMTEASYNSMSTAGTSTLYQISAVSGTYFEIADIAYAGNATGLVCRTDSDVLADKIVAVGDLLVRSYLDCCDGWVTSRVDPIMSNPLLDANWTAGIGTVGVGDGSSPITEIVPFAGGELVLTASGAFVYKSGLGAYLNVIPELEAHKHQDNGKGSIEHKGWVYIPTVIGLLRYRTGQTQNVTPGRGGQQGFETPTNPFCWLTGDAERLYGAICTFRVNQPKQVNSVQTAIYVDYNNTGTAPTGSDFNFDPSIDLNGLTTNGYIYLGSTEPWHRMHIEMDTQLNSLAYNLSGLRFGAAEYWSGSWTTRGTYIDYTRIRNDSAKYPSSLGTSGDIVFTGDGLTVTTGEMPPTSGAGEWLPNGTTPYADALLETTGVVNMYWCRFKVSAAINNSVVIKRVTAGIHVPEVTMTPALTGYDRELQVDHGGMQFIVSMKEEQGKPVVWDTMWGWQTPDTTMTDDNGGAAYISGGAQPVGACAIIQPNALRSAQGARYLFVGLQHNSMVLPLGHGPDPTEDGPYLQQFGGTGRDYWLVFPDTDCGMPFIQKTLQEIKCPFSGFTAANVEAFYRVDGGTWTSAGAFANSTAPIILTAGSEPQGLMFGLAIRMNLTANTRTVTLPRISTMPAIRVQPHPEMTESITMTVELDVDAMGIGQSNRRSAKTSYNALKALQTNNVSVSYVDVDESEGNIHILDCTKHVVHNSDNEPIVVADLSIAVV